MLKGLLVGLRVSSRSRAGIVTLQGTDRAWRCRCTASNVMPGRHD